MCFSLVESINKQLSWHSVHTTVRRLSEETTSVARTLTPTTVIQSSDLVTRYETKNCNPAKSTFAPPKLSSPTSTTSQWLSRQDSTKLYTTSEPITHTPKSSERKITTSFYLVHGTSSWNDDDTTERKTSSESGFLTPVSSLNIIRSTGYFTESKAKSPGLQTPSYSTSSLPTKKKSTTGTLTSTAQDIRTLVSGVTSPGSTNVWSSISTAIRNSSKLNNSKSTGLGVDLLITTKERDRSKLGPTSSSAVTYRWGSETVNLTIGGSDISASRLSPITNSNLSSSLPYKLSESTNVVNSLEGSLPGNTFSNEWVSSQSISPITLDGQYSTTVKETSSLMKSSFSDQSRSTWSMLVSLTPAVGFSIHESVSSFRKVHETSQSARLSELISTESKLVSSGSLRDDFTPVVMTPFTSLSLFAIQGSSAVEKVLTPTKATSLSVTQRTNPSPRSTNQVVSETEKHSLAISTSLRYTRHYGISTAEDITSLKTFTLFSSLLQTSPSISQPQSVINATSFGGAVILNSNYGKKSSLLGSSPGELTSLPVAMVSSHSSVSSHTTYDYLPTFASEATTNGFSSWIATHNIASHIPSSNSKSALASRKMSTQQWHAGRSTDSVQHLNPKSNVKERLATNLTIQTTKRAHANQQTLHKRTNDALAVSTITISPITTPISSKQSTALSKGLQSIAKSLSAGQLTPRGMSSHSENTRISTVTSSGEHLTSSNPHETSQHQTWYTTLTDPLEISTITRSAITPVISDSRGISTAEPASRTTISQLDNSRVSSSISSTLRPSSEESLNVSLSTKKAYSVSSMKLYNTLVNGSSDWFIPINATVKQSSIATMSPSIQSTIFSLNKSSASRIITLASSNISLYLHNITYLQYALTIETVRIFPSPTYTSATQIKPLKTTDSHSFSAVLTNIRPTSSSTARFKIMDGSLVIRNRKFHEDLSNPNTTMFKTLAYEMEEMIMNIVSLDAEVTSFRNGSIIASFYLLVAYSSPFSDRYYAQMLSEANETLWRGYQVENITVTLRADARRSAARFQDDGGLSKAAVAAIFTVFSVLLIAVGCFGVYICKKKGLCKQSRVKPAE